MQLIKEVQIVFEKQENKYNNYIHHLEEFFLVKNLESVVDRLLLTWTEHPSLVKSSEHPYEAIVWCWNLLAFHIISHISLPPFSSTKVFKLGKQNSPPATSYPSCLRANLPVSEKVGADSTYANGLESLSR
jgi:hypothetical protein